MNRCVRITVQATMMAPTLAAVNMVSTVTWREKTRSAPAFVLRSRSVLVAKVQYTAPAQLPTKVRMPTATTLKSEMPLYALDRSTDEMEFVPPKAKNVANWSRSVVVDSSSGVRGWELMNLKMTSRMRNRGTLVARDCVMAKRVKRWCSVAEPITQAESVSHVPLGL